MSLFPGALPVFTGFTSGHTLQVDTHAAQHNLEQAEIVNIATKVGTGASTPISGTVLRSSGTGTSTWGQVNLTTDVTGNLVGPTITGGGIWTGGPTFTNGGIWSGSPNIGTPIMTFTNAQHNHSNAVGGGQLTSTSITSFDTSLTTISNPYKFRAYRNAAANTGNGTFAVIAMDTEQFDTNGNLSAGVYTAPVNGFYQFNGAANVSVGNVDAALSLFKNGSEYSRGSQGTASGTTETGYTVSDVIQLVAGDTIDLRIFAATTKGLTVGSIAQNYLSGYLVSQT